MVLLSVIKKSLDLEKQALGLLEDCEYHECKAVCKTGIDLIETLRHQFKINCLPAIQKRLHLLKSIRVKQDMALRLTSQCIKFDGYVYGKVLEGYQDELTSMQIVASYRDAVPLQLKHILFRYQANLQKLKEIGCDSP